jgi:hypothetical protein
MNAGEVQRTAPIHSPLLRRIVNAQDGARQMAVFQLQMPSNVLAALKVKFSHHRHLRAGLIYNYFQRNQRTLTGYLAGGEVLATAFELEGLWHQPFHTTRIDGVSGTDPLTGDVLRSKR